MSASIENMREKIERTEDLGTVVHTMKALAASQIGQYEESTRALQEYYRTIVLGLTVCLRNWKRKTFSFGLTEEDNTYGAVIFGSDQGLVGQFNEALVKFTLEKIDTLPGNKKILVVGERVYNRLIDNGISVDKIYSVPNSMDAITRLTGRLLLESQITPFYIFYNRPESGTNYKQHMERLLPLDEQWLQEMTEKKWPTHRLPTVLGDYQQTLSALIREYLFVTLFKACTESLTAENASRLAAMQRAEKNIDEMLEDLNRTYHRVRQGTIDEELFDIVAGFEGLEQ